MELYNHTLSAGSSSGMITHFWSTACGAGVSFKGGVDSGVAIYRYYVDGEAEASVVFTPRDVAGVIFDPIGECEGPTCTHPAPDGASPTPSPSTAPRHDEYVIGDRGATCDEACASEHRTCNPVINPPGINPVDLGEMMADLVEYDVGARCTVDDNPWFAADQPSYVRSPALPLARHEQWTCRGGSTMLVKDAEHSVSVLMPLRRCGRRTIPTTTAVSGRRRRLLTLHVMDRTHWFSAFADVARRSTRPVANPARGTIGSPWARTTRRGQTPALCSVEVHHLHKATVASIWYRQRFLGVRSGLARQAIWMDTTPICECVSPHPWLIHSARSSDRSPNDVPLCAAAGSILQDDPADRTAACWTREFFCL